MRKLNTDELQVMAKKTLNKKELRMIYGACGISPSGGSDNSSGDGGGMGDLVWNPDPKSRRHPTQPIATGVDC